MPLPKPEKEMAKSRPNATRKGCWTCRRHHRKCDEHKPFCHRCVNEYGVECEGYGRRRVAFRMAGQPQVTQTQTKTQTQTQTQTPQSLTTISQSSRSPSRSPSIISRPSPQQLAITPLALAAFSSDEQRLLRVFCADFAPRAAISPRQDVFSLDIAPMAMAVAMAGSGAGTHSHVLAAVLSLSAAHVHVGGSDIRRMHGAFSYYDRAVRLLQSVEPASPQYHQAYLATIFLLAWFDILVFDPNKWTVHLRMACGLIQQQNVDALWATASGRRIVHAVARLDCSNALCNRAPALLCQRAYDLLEQAPHHSTGNLDYGPDCDLDFDPSLDQHVDAECMRLHGILGTAARLSYRWTLGQGADDVHMETLDVLVRLQHWHDELPSVLRWPKGDDRDDRDVLSIWLRGKPPLFKKLWLHYWAITVHLYHILEPVGSGLWDASVAIARRCLVLVRVCDEDDHLNRGDMSVLFVLAVSGVLIEDHDDRAWIQSYLLQHGRETLWCGYERAACLHAWWNSIGVGKRLILSQPDRDDGSDDDAGVVVRAKPRVKVRIVYEDLVTRQVQADLYEVVCDELVVA